MSNSDGVGDTQQLQGAGLASLLKGVNPQVFKLLLEHAPLLVAGVANDHSVLYSNGCRFWEADATDELANAVLGCEASDALPPPLVEERRGFVRQAAHGSGPLAVIGMLRGRLTTTIYCRTDARSEAGSGVASGEGPHVLVVACPVTEFNEATPLPTQGQTHPGLMVIRARYDDLGLLAALTERELQVLRLIGQGLTAAEIGAKMHRAVKTIEGHRVSLGTKLRLRGKADLVRIAIVTGLTTLGEREVTLLARQARLTADLS